MAGNRVGAGEYERRVNEVFKRIVGGMPPYELLHYITSTFGVKKRQAKNYIRDANLELAEQAAHHRPGEIGRAIRRLNDLYSATMRVQDYQRALAAQRELNRLLGLYAPEQPKTILLGDLDPAQVKTLTDALERQGLRASDLFNSILAELDAEREKSHG